MASQQAAIDRRRAYRRGRSRAEVAKGRGGRVVALLILLAAVWTGGVPLLAQQQAPQRTPAQEGFVPVDTLPSAQEQLPAAPLVMAAYAVAWVAVFGYLVSIWMRLGRVERDIAAVSRRVEAGGRR